MKWIKAFENFNYRTGSVFTDEKEKKLCLKLNSLSKFLVDDKLRRGGVQEKGLGLKSIINDILSNHKVVKDINDEYQDVFKILKDIKDKGGREIFNDISYVNGRYTHRRFGEAGLVRDENDQYHFVNKLNTNYSDLSELLTKVLVGLNLTYLSDSSNGMIKSVLLKSKPDIEKYIKDYFNIDEIKSFTRNSISTSKRGDDSENYVSSVLEKFGMKSLYQGGNGDFVDMVFGIDLIMEYKGRIITCQVKSSSNAAKSSTTNNYYKRINYFISPLSGIGSDIIIYNNLGDSFMISKEGELIR
tara:strand:- start:84 stop:983 length:900 start_codon:yes stop_codon:yes gene_type:complete